MGKPDIVYCTNDLEQGPFSHKELDPHQDEALVTSLPNTYHDKIVKPRLQHQPGFEHLQQFMDPAAKGFAIDLDRRMLHFDIKVLQFTKSEKTASVTSCSTLDDLENAIAEDKDTTGTLLIAEEISRAMIEALGTTFDLEPEFFANHLVGTELYRTGRHQSPTLRAPARTLNLLPICLRGSPFYAVEYRRPSYIEGGLEEVAKRRANRTNTPRGTMFIHYNLPDVLVCERISVYKKKGSKIGIILTDRLLSDLPSSSSFPHQVTALDEDPQSLGPHGLWRRVSSRQKLISWFQHLTPADVKSLFNDDEPMALRPILKIVESSGLVFLAHASYMLKRVLHFDCDAQFPDNIPFFLHIARSLYHILHEQGRILRYTLRVMSFYDREGSNFEEQRQDFGYVAEEIESMLKSLEEDVRFLVGEASIREGKIVGWVSKFAALFLPVSLLATILSISNPGYVRWAVLGGLSVPFVLTSVYFMFLWKPANLNRLRSH